MASRLFILGGGSFEVKQIEQLIFSLYHSLFRVCVRPHLCMPPQRKKSKGDGAIPFAWVSRGADSTNAGRLRNA